jgi:hypothetical protein
MKNPLVCGTVLLCVAWAVTGAAEGVLEVPAPNSTQTGIGIISGWHCSANRIEIVIDGAPPLLAGSHTERKDTLNACGRSDTGFSLLWNWNLLPTDCFGCRYHHIVALADGIPFADAVFQVESFGTEFMTGKSGMYTLLNFPAIGDTTWVQWDEAKQNFSVYLTELRPDASIPGTNVSGTYYGGLESGAHNPACGPWPSDRKLPVRYGSFLVQVANGHMSLAAQYVDGTTCALPDVALAPYDPTLDSNGYVRAVFDQAAAASCPEFPGGVSVRVDGLRLAADSLDNCITAAVRGAR